MSFYNTIFYNNFLFAASLRVNKNNNAAAASAENVGGLFLPMSSSSKNNNNNTGSSVNLNGLNQQQSEDLLNNLKEANKENINSVSTSSNNLPKQFNNEGNQSEPGNNNNTNNTLESRSAPATPVDS